MDIENNNNIDMKGQEFKNSRFVNLSTPPLNPKLGQHYFDTATKEDKYWNGAEWVGEYELFIDVNSYPTTDIKENCLYRKSDTYEMWWIAHPQYTAEDAGVRYTIYPYTTTPWATVQANWETWKSNLGLNQITEVTTPNKTIVRFIRDGVQQCINYSAYTNTYEIKFYKNGVWHNLIGNIVVNWGSITGDITNQTDLQQSLNEKIKHYSTMPTASGDYAEQTVQYIGVTNADFIHNYFYECVSNGATPPTYSWQNVNIQEIKGDVFQSAIASVYSESSTYAIGDVVMHDGLRYKCNTAISTAEAWNASHWTSESSEDAKQNKVYYGSVAPANPKVGDIWINSVKLPTSDYLKSIMKDTGSHTVIITDDSGNETVISASDLNALTSSGGNLTGTITASVQNVIKSSSNDSSVEIYGGSNYNGGGSVILNGQESDNGSIEFRAKNASSNNKLKINVGSININSHISRSGGDMIITRDANDSYSSFYGGTGWQQGGGLHLVGKDLGSAGNGGAFKLFAHNGTIGKMFEGWPDGTLKWNGNNVLTDGFVGQIIQNSRSGSWSIVANTNTKLISITLTPGTWIVTGQATFGNAGSGYKRLCINNTALNPDQVEFCANSTMDYPALNCVRIITVSSNTEYSLYTQNETNANTYRNVIRAVRIK